MIPKLVRDLIPKIIHESGKKCKYRIINDIKGFESALVAKMNEEMSEFMENPSYDEAADIYEVLYALAWLHKIDMAGIVTTAIEKRQNRGGFHKGIILESVEGENNKGAG
jgi:predicted house-cleaning noncanonical NTP pyrophosphatase (MazG superfamily)